MHFNLPSQYVSFGIPEKDVSLLQRRMNKRYGTRLKSTYHHFSVSLQSFVAFWVMLITILISCSLTIDLNNAFEEFSINMNVHAVDTLLKIVYWQYRKQY